MRRFVVVFLLFASCATSTTDTGAGADRPATTTTSSVKDAGAATNADKGSSTTTKRASSGGSRTATSAAPRPPSTSPAQQRPSTPAVPGDGGATGPPGAYARTILRPSPANAVAVDLIAQTSAALRTSTTDHLVSVLQRETTKSVGIARGKELATDDQQWTPSELVAAADANAGARGTVDRPVLHVLVVHGGLEGDDNAIGVAVRGDVYAVFVDHVADASTPLVPARVIEDAVAIHELGHLLGLVDLALDRNRDDPDHPGHSTNRESVMYWAIDSDLVTQVLGGPPATDFDQEDRADLATLRNGG